MAKKITHKKQSIVPKASLLIGVFLFIVTSLTTVLIYSTKDSVCANSLSCISDLTGVYNTEENEGEFHGQRVPLPFSLAYASAVTNVLGSTTQNNKRIEVDLENQKLYAFEENKLVYEFPISSGKWGKTPTGDFRIWVKLRYTRMSGGSKELGTYYNLPNVPYTMFFYNEAIPKSRGFGIHGAYWHNNFGHPMSHGCINMRTEDVEKIYYWASPTSGKGVTYATEEDPGTPIKIYGVAPNN